MKAISPSMIALGKDLAALLRSRRTRRERRRDDAFLPPPWMEVLEPRVLLSTAGGAAPFAAPVFTALPATPTIVSAPSDTTGKIDSNEPYADAVVYWDNGDGTETVSALLGQSGGTFNPQTIATVTGTILDVQAVDLTNNGKLDVVVYWEVSNSPTSGNIDVYMGNGDGTFTHAGTTLSTFNDGTLNILDMLGNGKQDLLVEDQGLDSVQTFLGQGNGTFGSAQETDFGTGHTIVSLNTDLSGDGIVDAILNYSTFTNSTENENLEVHLGESSGLFNTTASFTNSGDQSQFSQLEVLAGSTLPAIIATQEAPSTFTGPESLVVFANQGGGNFTQSFSESYPNGVLDTLFGDINGDNKPDMVVIEGNFSSRASVIAHVEIGGSNATFTDGETFTIPDYTFGELVDVDNTGKVDLAVGQSDEVSGGSTAVSVYFNSAGTLSTTPVTVTPTLSGTGFGFVYNFNENSKLLDPYFESTTIDSSTDTITDTEIAVAVNNGNETFGTPQVTDFGANTVVNEIPQDLNGDKVDDALVFQDVDTEGGDADAFEFYPGNADGTFTTPTGEVTFPGAVNTEADLFNFTGTSASQDLYVLGDAPTGIYVVTQTASTTPAPSAGVTGGGLAINDGSTTPTTGTDTDFGSVVQGAARVTQTYTITNGGTAALTVGTVSVPTGFTLVTAPAASVAAGNSTTFVVGLPTATTGTFAGNVSFATNDPNNPAYTFAVTGTVTPPTVAAAAVTGNGQPIADGSTTPSTTNDTSFGSAVQGSATVDETYTITNSGTAALTVGTVTVPSGFTLVTAPASTVPASFPPGPTNIAVDTTTTFTVGLTTTATGTFSGNVSFTTNDPNNPTYTFAVSGTVTATAVPAAAVTGNGQAIADGATTTSNANATDFGSAVQGAATIDETYTIANSGDAALTVGTVAVPTGFTLVTPPDATVAAGQTTTLTVALPTTTAGTFAGNVVIPTNDPSNLSYTFAITGTITAVSSNLPTITQLTNNGPVTKGSSLTLTASGVSAVSPATIKAVTFYSGTSDTFSTGTTKVVGKGKLTGAGTYTLTLTTTKLAVGSDFFFAMATDSKKNASTPAQTTVTILDTPPTIKSISVLPANPIAGVALSFKATGVADKYNTVTSVTYYWDPTPGSGTGTLTGAVDLGTSTTKGTFPLLVPAADTTAFPTTGKATFLAVATDASGTVSTTPAVLNVSVDTPPVIGTVTVNPTSVAVGQPDTATITGVTDVNAVKDKIKQVTVYAGSPGATAYLTGDTLLGKAKLTSAATGTYTFTGTIPKTIPPATYPLFVVVTTTKGEVAVAGPTPLTVTSPAAVVAATPALSAAGPVTFTAADPGATAVQFWLAPVGSTTLDPIADTFLGSGTQQSSGAWALTLNALTGVSPGDYVVFSRALDANGIAGAAVGSPVTMA